MKRGMLAFLAGVGLAGVVAIWVEALQKRGVISQRETRADRQQRRREGLLDLNRATDEELLALGITRADFRERIRENRPYRNRLDLVARMVIPQNVYNQIKNRIRIEGAEQAVKVAR